MFVQDTIKPHKFLYLIKLIINVLDWPHFTSSESVFLDKRRQCVSYLKTYHKPMPEVYIFFLNNPVNAQRVVWNILKETMRPKENREDLF